MDVLILGGSRFIGRRLAREWLDEPGHRVTLFNRGRAPDGLGPAIERLRGDRRSERDLAAAFESRRFDVVYDFLSYDAHDAGLAVRTLGGRAGHFVHLSTCSVYWCAGSFPCPVTEDDFPRLDVSRERPDSIEYAYGTGKRAAEETLMAAHHQDRFPVTIVRMPIVGGEEDASGRYEGYVRRLLDGAPLVLPDGGHAPFRHVYVGDVTRALRALGGRVDLAGEAFNLAGDEILTLRRLVSGIAAVLDRDADPVDVPADIARRDAGEAFAALYPFSQTAAQVPAIHKARRVLAWETTPWSVWMERAVGWCLDRKDAPAGAPPALEHRHREIDLARRWRQAMISFDEAASTSEERPG